MKLLHLTLPLIMTLISAMVSTAADWKIADASLTTEWGEKVTPDTAWTQYPRPQLVRKNWTNLNGLWNYSVTKKAAKNPGKWAGEILVPYCIESPLSGVGHLLKPTEALWYERSFDLASKPNGRLLLNFEAVDYESEVWVNGNSVGKHVGGNLPFSFDISDQVKKGKNSLRLKVLDATSAEGSFQLRGKQRLENRGIWYTRVSGIWQTVWLEEVPKNHIENLRIQTDMSGRVTVEFVATGSAKAKVSAVWDGREVASASGDGEVILKISNPRLWSPDEPNLYDLKVELEGGDSVSSYLGIREVGKVYDDQGGWQFTLNGKRIFHWGPLDQGWWPDGLLTPPADDAMIFEIGWLKEAGFNMIRKHIKVEPRRYYYHCDKIGMLVWQDQPSGGAQPKWMRLSPLPDRPGIADTVPKPGESHDAEWPDEHHEQFMTEFQSMVDKLYNHPSIVVWVPFNERWAQHRTMEVGEWILEYDSSRHINIASGGNFFPVGHIADAHKYPEPFFYMEDEVYKDYIRVVGEFGGHGWPQEGHIWDLDLQKYSYGGMPKTIEEMRGRYRNSMEGIGKLKAQGISGAVYTQTTDVEGEVNGLMTYDRKFIKIPAKELKTLHRKHGLTP
ncbi:MAG: glycoside hydrolase family 2 [Verrucomicrobia bacterium]|nr:glycoside hydrolase family 2 [Verrucomicrobiota bacterium]